jgi:hypothetical protein
MAGRLERAGMYRFLAERRDAIVDFAIPGPSYERSMSSPKNRTGRLVQQHKHADMYGTLVDMRREDFMHPIIIAAKTQFDRPCGWTWQGAERLRRKYKDK